MQATIDGWIEVTRDLSPLQNLCIVGILFQNPRTSLSIIATRDPVTPENISAAERWAKLNFRKLLYFYCDNSEKTGIQLGVALADKSGVVKKLGPVIVSTFSIPLGMAVAFLFAASGIILKNWCANYARREFNGKGIYAGDFPKKQLEAFFEIEFYPPIQEYTEDPEAYPLKGYRINILVPAEVNGKAKVPLPADSDEIFFSFKENTKHSFRFADTKRRSEIDGDITTLRQDRQAGPSVLGFTTDVLRGI